MARSRAALVTLAIMACVAMNAVSFVAPPKAEVPVSALALGAGLAPGAAQALDTFDAQQLEVGSSVSVAATVEALMLGIVLGTVPITVLGLFVSAWLQFKKGPTLGI